jgi:hypothetical protein
MAADMQKKPAITPLALGTPWSSKARPEQGLAELAVDDDWVSSIAGSSLHAWVEPGLGPCVGICAKLPSGIMIELVRGDLGGPLYALYVDGDADLGEAMNEFLNVTGLDPTAVRWRSPYA